MSLLYNRVKALTTTTGTGTFTWGTVVVGFCTPAEAGASDGDVITYLLKDGDDFELGRGTYTASGTTTSRDVVLLSKIGGTAGTTKMNLSGSATVEIVAAAEDIGRSWRQIGSWDFSTAVAAVPFTSLAGWSEVMVFARGLTASVSSGRLVQVSTDNGSTYFNSSGDYIAIDANGAETNTTSPGLDSSNTTAAVSAFITFHLWNVNGYFKPLFVPNRAITRLVAKTAPLNALQIAASTGNITGGSIRVFGR